MKLLKKAIFRVIKTIIDLKGIYGKLGRHKRFTKGVFVSEGALIGNYNYFGPYIMINNAVIGNYCSRGLGIKIRQGKHSLTYINTYQNISSDITGHSLNTELAIIGNDICLGANIVIIQGLKIGDGAVITENTVVTKDSQDYAVAIGIPAKVTKYRFSSDKIKTIKCSRWFDYDINYAKKIDKSLEEILD